MPSQLFNAILSLKLSSIAFFISFFTFCFSTNASSSTLTAPLVDQINFFSPTESARLVTDLTRLKKEKNNSYSSSSSTSSSDSWGDGGSSGGGGASSDW